MDWSNFQNASYFSIDSLVHDSDPYQLIFRHDRNESPLSLSTETFKEAASNETLLNSESTACCTPVRFCQRQICQEAVRPLVRKFRVEIARFTLTTKSLRNLHHRRAIIDETSGGKRAANYENMRAVDGG